MKVKINDIIIGPRIRQEAGDLFRLKDSIQKMGLLNPIIINEKNELISGFRRLEACKQLGWTDVEVIVVATQDDKVKELDVEYHENIGRMDLGLQDQEYYSQKREELLKPRKPQNALIAFLRRIWNFILRLFKKEDS